MELRCFLGLWLYWLPVFLGLFAPVWSIHRNRQLFELYSWDSLDFQYPSQTDRDSAVQSGSFTPGSPVPVDVDFYQGNGQNRVFVTIPRFQNGVPVTIGYVTDEKNSAGEPIIAAYPNMDIQDTSYDCTGIKSVWRISIDSCDRLWILDTGKIVEDQVCPPQLFVYSLRDNSLLKRYVFPKDQYVESSLYVTPIVDIRDSNGSCDDTFVYIADVTGFSMIVYDHYNSRSWRIVNKLFYPYPQYGTFDINGETFDLMDGILGMALSPFKQNGDRILFFHSLASRTESWVPTSIIRNYTIFEHSPESALRSFTAFPRERSSQSAAEVMNKDGILFFGLMSDLAIACWNSRTEYGGRNIEKIVTNRKTLQFASGMKIVDRNDREELWIMTISFQKVMTGTLNPQQTNFRVQVAYVDELIRETKCQVDTDFNNVPAFRGLRSFSGHPQHHRNNFYKK